MTPLDEMRDLLERYVPAHSHARARMAFADAWCAARAQTAEIDRLNAEAWGAAVVICAVLESLNQTRDMLEFHVQGWDATSGD